MEYASKSHVDKNVKSYLEEASNLRGQEGEGGFITVYKYKCQSWDDGGEDYMGFCKHALTLGFYCLLKQAETPDSGLVAATFDLRLPGRQRRQGGRGQGDLRGGQHQAVQLQHRTELRADK